MSIPTNSIGPAAPTGSSNPVSFKQWFINIVDWIKGLSPVGATSYDSGWLPLTAVTGNTTTGAARRTGRLTKAQGDILPTSSGTLTPSAFRDIAVLPAGMAPASAILMPCYSNTTGDVQARILTDGTIQVILKAGSANLAITAATRFSITYASWISAG